MTPDKRKRTVAIAAVAAAALALAAGTYRHDSVSRAAAPDTPAAIDSAETKTGIDAQAEQLIEQAAAAHRELKSYSADIRLTVKQASGTRTIMGTLAYRQPDHAEIRTLAQPDGKSFDLIWNGLNVYVIDSRDPQHYKKFMATTPDHNIAQAIDSGQGSLTGLLSLMIGDADAAKKMLSNVSAVTRAGEQNIGGTDCELVKVTGKEIAPASLTVTLALGKTDHLLRRSEMKTVQPDGSSAEVSESYLNILANPPLPDSRFAYVPAHGITLASPPDDEGARYDRSLKSGAKPFPITGTDLDGKPAMLSKYKGRVLLLDFWATWCAPCREEIPNTVAMYAKYHRQGFDVLGISMDQADNRAGLTDFVHQNHMPWPEVFEGREMDSPNATRYGVQSIPFTLLIGRDGRIAAVDPFGPYLEPAIEAALAKKP